MHEYAITESIFEVVLNTAKKENVKSVVKASIEIGPFSSVYFDQVRFWWDIMIKDTILENADLVCIKLPGKIKCNDCDSSNIVEFDEIVDRDVQTNFFQCKNCASYRTEILEGRDVKIGDLEVIMN
ncbi:MAG: hydrogenase maturation nickel metallochaperone HypA/HybF [Candidatus Hodarchaeales archaeon]|jgi:hydrogenase nickel incorporation protein HypA/HybF